MRYIVEKEDGSEVEKNEYTKAKRLFDESGVRLWKRKPISLKSWKHGLREDDELIDSKPGYEE